MKRICAALLAALLLCGCGNAAKTPAESTEPEETVPVWTVAPDGNSTDVTCKGSYTGQGSENTVVARVGPITNLGDRLVLDTNNGVYSLAGSCLKLCDSIRNVHRFTGIPVEQLIPCATENPAKYVGVFDTKGSIAPGKDADINIFDADMNLLETYIKGQKIN